MATVKVIGVGPKDAQKVLQAFSSRGGFARAKALTQKERSEIARNAVTARWDRARKNGTG